MIQLTNYEPSTKIINTEYGELNYNDWLTQEKCRLRQAKVSAQIKYKSGQCALYVDDRGLKLRKESEDLKEVKHCALT
jgi:hypothetical protein